MSYKVRDFVRPAMRVADIQRADPLVEGLGGVLAAQSAALRATHKTLFKKVDRLLAGPRPNPKTVMTGTGAKLRLKPRQIGECLRCGDAFFIMSGHKTCSVKCGVEHRRFLRGRGH